MRRLKIACAAEKSVTGGNGETQNSRTCIRQRFSDGKRAMYLSSTYLSIYPTIHPSIHIYSSIHPTIHSSIYASIYTRIFYFVLVVEFVFYHYEKSSRFMRPHRFAQKWTERTNERTNNNNNKTPSICFCHTIAFCYEILLIFQLTKAIKFPLERHSTRRLHPPSSSSSFSYQFLIVDPKLSLDHLIWKCENRTFRRFVSFWFGCAHLAVHWIV